MTKVEALKQLCIKLIDNNCENLIDNIVLKKDIQSSLHLKLSTDQLKEIREASILKFSELINQHSEGIVENVKV